MSQFKTYIYNHLVLFSKTLNTVLGGTPHESISQKIGRKYYYEGNVWGPWVIAHDLVNAIFFWETNHIKDAIDGEDYSKDVWDL